MDDAVSLNVNNTKPRVGGISEVSLKLDPKKVSDVLRGMTNGKFQSQPDVQTALGASLNLGRSATDAEVVATLDQCAQNLEQLGPGARSNFVEKYNNISSI